MQRQINIPDLVSGLLLIAVALVALVLAWPLRVGTAFRMGPGYLPLLLCFLQIALGLVVAAQSFFMPGEGLELWAPRPILFILAAVTYFGLTIEPLGLLVSVAGLVVISGLADRSNPFLHVVLLAVGLAAFAVLVFVTGLKLPLNILPRFMIT